MGGLLGLFIAVFFLFLRDVNEYRTQKEGLARNISLVKSKMRSTPELNGVHYFNLAVCWQERFAFSKALNLYKKSIESLINMSSEIEEDERLLFIGFIKENIDYCSGKSDWTDSNFYYSYSSRFGGSRVVTFFKKEIYEI